MYKDKDKAEPKKNIVVIGYGWGGKNFCDNINHRKYNVTVVSKTNGMLDTTKLKKVSKPLVMIKSNLGSAFINRECVEVDTQLKQVKLTGDLILPYDILVLAVGSVANDFGIKGITEHCHFLKTVEDHAKLQQALLDIKRSEDPIVIIGAGPTGIELAFELSKDGYKVSLVDAMPNILPMFSSNIAHIVTKQLEKYGIALHLNTKIEHIDKNHINHNIPYKLAVWTCGVKANPLIRQITSAPIVPVNDNLQVVNANGVDQDIYAIGDITAHGPLTAQKAKQQGIYLAKKLNRMSEVEVEVAVDADIQLTQEPFVYKEYIKILNTRDFMLVDAKDANLVFRIPRF